MAFAAQELYPRIQPLLGDGLDTIVVASYSDYLEQATDLHVPDLRAGFSYVLAALSAQGTSTISGASLLDRGYENFRVKLLGVGAKLH